MAPHCGHGWCKIAHTACDRPLHGHCLESQPAFRCRRAVEEWRHAPTRTEASHSGAESGIADRSEEVVGVGDGPYTSCHGYTGTATGTSRRSVRGPWIKRQSVQIVLAGPTQRHGGRIRSSDYDRPGCTQTCHRRTVLIRNKRTPGYDAVRCRGSLLVHIVLHRNRHAMKRAQNLTSRGCGIGKLCGGYGLSGEMRDHGIDGRVNAVEPIQARLHDLDAGHIPPRHGSYDFRRVPGPRLAGFPPRHA